MSYASTACLGRPDLWAALDAFRESGIDAVELGACRLGDDSNLAGRLRATGLRFAVHNYFPPGVNGLVLNLASPSGDVRTQRVRFVRSSLELAAEIGAAAYSVHAGFVTDPVGFEDGRFVFDAQGDADAARERFADSIDGLAAHAERLGVDLLVENNVCVESHRGQLLFVTGDEIASFEPLRDRRVRLLVDTGHLNVSSRTLGFDRSEFADAVDGYVGAVHVHDNDRLSDEHRPVDEDSWIAALLRRPGFNAVPQILEARVASAAEAKEQIDLLERWAGDD